LREIATLNDHLALLVQKIGNSKAKHTFFDALSKNPTEFIARWLRQQEAVVKMLVVMSGGGVGRIAFGEAIM